MPISDTRFKPGQSGNPGGRPKEIGYVRDLAREHTEEAIEKLVAIMRSSTKESLCLAAAEALLSRGWGRPLQPMEGKFDVGHASPNDHKPELRKALEDAKQRAIQREKAEEHSAEAPIKGADNPPEMAPAVAPAVANGGELTDA